MSKEVIRISRGEISKNRFRDLMESKNLIYFFTWRELKVRYRQTALGVLWVGLQPIVFMAIVQLILLRRLGGDYGVEGVPAYIMIYIGFSFWRYFEGGFNGVINSFTANQNLFQKIYIPKLVPAIATVIAKIIDLLLAIVLMLILSLVFGYKVYFMGFVMLAVMIVIVGFASLGIGMYLGMLNVKYRDVRQIMPFFIRLGFLSSAIFWPISLIPEPYQPFLYLNPAAAGIQTLREAFYQPSAIRWEWLPITLAVTIFFMVLGYWYFSKTEREMVDIV